MHRIILLLQRSGGFLVLYISMISTNSLRFVIANFHSSLETNSLEWDECINLTFQGKKGKIVGRISA